MRLVCIFDLCDILFFFFLGDCKIFRRRFLYFQTQVFQQVWFLGLVSLPLTEFGHWIVIMLGHSLTHGNREVMHTTK